MSCHFKQKENAFISVLVCIFGCILLLFSLLEYEMLSSLLQCHTLERERQEKLEKEDLLKELLYVEEEEIKTFLSSFPEKTIFDYFTKNKEGKALFYEIPEEKSYGGYSIITKLPERVPRDRYKIYYQKEYQIPEKNYHYQIKVLVEYHYGKRKKIEDFISQKIIELRIYLL